jgi:hypothetical protein
VDGRLPNGIWRLNPLTGVIWGVPTEPGEFPVKVEVSDSTGKSAQARLVLQSRESGQPPVPPAVPWLFQEIKTSGPLRIVTESLPDAILGIEYSAICLAQGGKPHKADPKRPGSGRYWEFADDTLLSAYQRDSVHQGKDGTAIPHPKTYLREVGDQVVMNQVTWWPGRERADSESIAFAGYTEDATKHLKKLVELGLVQRTVNTGKPERLLARLLDIFTESGDTVLELFGESGDLSAVALKAGRRFVYLSGTSDRQRELLEACVLPRLRAVIDGKDRSLEDREGEIRMRSDAYIPFGGGGGFIACDLGTWLFERQLREDFPRLNRVYAGFEELRSALLTSQGFLPFANDEGLDGRRLDGHSVAVVIPPEDYLDRAKAAQIASGLKPDYHRVVVYYFRSAEDFDQATLPDGVVCQRVPTEVSL